MLKNALSSPQMLPSVSKMIYNMNKYFLCQIYNSQSDHKGQTYKPTDVTHLLGPTQDIIKLLTCQYDAKTSIFNMDEFV